MRTRFVICILFAVVAVLGDAAIAGAQDGAGQNPQTSAGAATGPGEVSVNAGESWTPPPGSMLTQMAQSSSSESPGSTNPNQPYGCTFTVASLAAPAFRSWRRPTRRCCTRSPPRLPSWLTGQ